MTYIDKFLANNLVWDAISTRLVGRAKLVRSRFYSMNCPCCVSRNETPDKKHRCGIKNDAKGVGINCFNCGFKALFRVGSQLSYPMSEFMLAIGIPSDEVMRLKHWAYAVWSLASNRPEVLEDRPAVMGPVFTPHPLPPQAKSIVQWAGEDCSDPDFENAVSYLYSRGDDLFNVTTYYWTPERTNDLNRRIIIPCYHEGRLVGWTARAIDSTKPKYWNDTPNGLLFNMDAMHAPNRKYVILVEGIFDALAIDATALMKSSLSETQAFWIDSCDKIKIVVPDRDKAGQDIIDIALKHGWMVSFPRHISGRGWWQPDIKDVADAVLRYGRLWTLRSIIASATSNAFEINMRRKKLQETHNKSIVLS